MSNMWGFDLDMTAVRLMRRNEGDWQEVAAEKIEGADIEERLMALVSRIEDDAPVELFLPRDQILVTDVAVGSEDSARSDIEAALDGATPYPLDELDLDWEMIAPDQARVAAIAFETLDEAVAFAEVRGVRVGGFSSLALGADFPRLPAFTGHNSLAPDEDLTPPVTFASARVVSKPRPDAPSLAPVPPETVAEPPETAAEALEPGTETAAPVVAVPDEAPVIALKAPVAPPLDPGTPMAGPAAAPRVRTDIAASVVSDQAASLTPPHVKVRSGPTHWKIGAVMAVALLITVGVATLVWKMIPLGPGEPVVPISQDQGGMAPEAAPGIETARAPAPTPTPDVVPDTVRPEAAAAPADPVEDPAVAETETAALAPTDLAAPQDAPAETADTGAAVPDLPVPVFAAGTAELTAPGAGAAPQLTALAPVQLVGLSVLDPVERRTPALPFVDLGLPLEPTPAALAALTTDAPGLATAPVESGGQDVIFAAIDPTGLSLDAIALPNAAGFAPGPLPGHGDSAARPTPEPDDEQEPELAETPQPRADGLPAPTALARGLTDRSPSKRPTRLVEQIERQKYGGRTRAQLARLRPPQRPASDQMVALAERAAVAGASDLAIAASPDPRARPADFDEVVTAARAQSQAETIVASLDYRTPDTNAAIAAALSGDVEPEPRRAAPAPAAPAPQVSIPSSASVARQATIENALRLNKVNLVGVYGSASDRRALVRLASGRVVKVKVGDRVDGGTVAQIKDDELLYKKGSRTLSLSMPKG